MKYLIKYIVMVLIVIFYQNCSKHIASSNGGSGTETVGKVIDNYDYLPVENAVIKLFPSDSLSNNDTLYDTTDSKGEYEFKTDSGDYFQDNGSYSMIGFNKDTSLMFIRSDIIITDGKRNELGVDTMKAPGSLSGNAVLVDGSNHEGILIFIAGTSFNGYTDSAGSFKLSGIPEGTYILTYKYDNYETIKSDSQTVISGENTNVATVTLQRDPDMPPPEPENVSAVYDTATGTVTITWKSTVVSDLYGYNIYRDSGSADNAVLLGSTQDTFFNDSILSDLSDLDINDSVLLRYRVKSLDTNSNESISFSNTSAVTAVSPALIKTTFNWTLVPEENDSVTIGDSARITCTFSNPSRINEHIIWFIDSIDTPVCSSEVNTMQGSDTLVYSFTDSGKHIIFIKAVDNGGGSWTDSTSISILDSTVIMPVDSWETALPMNRSRRMLCASASNPGDRIYSFGGFEEIIYDLGYTSYKERNCVSSVEVLNVNTGVWSESDSLPEPRFGFSSVTAQDGFYLIGGANLDTEFSNIIKYNPESGVWTEAADMPSPKTGTASCYFGGKIFIFGGLERFTVTSSIDMFNPETGIYTENIAELNTPRTNHECALIDSTIYIMGGLGDNTNLADSRPLSSMETFNPADYSTSVSENEMSSPRYNFGAASANGRLYAIGGKNISLLKSTESYDPSTGEWSYVEDIPSAVSGFGTAVCGGIIYVIGGTENSTEPFGQTGTVYKYYPLAK